MSHPFRHGVILDGATLGPGLDLSGLQALAETWDWHEHSSAEAVPERMAEADLVITNKVAIGRTALARARSLRCICVAATGFDHVDTAAAGEHGVAVVNCTHYATASVVQHTFALITALVTRLEAYHAAVRAGRWSASPQFCLFDYPITELDGKTLGIVGYGTLGRAVASVAAAFGMHVIVAARPGSRTTPRDRVGLPSLLASADVVTLHCPLTGDTRGMMDAEGIARMKPDALLINTARGPLVDERALADALRAQSIAGAGVDVLSAEPPPRDHPLLAHDIPNLIVTPHSAWASQAARQRLVDQIVSNMHAFARGEPRNLVGGAA
jgi:glycerate dehydrogenase